MSFALERSKIGTGKRGKYLHRPVFKYCGMEDLRKIGCRSTDPSKSQTVKSVRKSPGKKPVPTLFDRCCMISDMIARMTVRRDHRPCDGDLCSIVSHDPEPAMIGKGRIDLIQVDIGSGDNRNRDLLCGVLSRALKVVVGTGMQ